MVKVGVRVKVRVEIGVRVTARVIIMFRVGVGFKSQGHRVRINV